ncbi:conserved hypothetical protein [Leishmania major strain Friedlin]|uniref:Uncharacterized protein n=1 Tax=Leishmania major TaxID=5664 RepID=Q4QHB8_LEIMA|nr:conserved hypothetical protein [Leishmania major strain Friedlin]CAG9570080.1 hypothetical_protein_-_conserved [Leishmania major strain Friedlin]CAJ02893.1 conserved hypothetical protein [Leishmania major strain Friedlin]|eukprot:XP_001681430.1 conserved hypothetical protein [Leishmania major strain Friedlin]
MPPGQMAVSRHKPRRASAASFRKNTSSEVASICQQLHDALQQQSRLEVQRQQQLVQYRRRLRTLCDDNATLRNIIHAGERRRRDAEAAAAAGLVMPTGARAHNGAPNEPATVTEAEVEALSQRIYLARQRRNKVLHEIKADEAALDAEAKSQESLMEQAQIALDPAKLLMGANRPVYLRMMRLEQLVDKVLSKQRIAGVVLANYRHHLGVLSTEAAQYDAQQTLLEREYADRHRDHLKLLQLYDTARAAYSTAVEALQVVQRSASRMRTAKEKALQQKRREVDKGLVATQQQERRVVDRQQQLEEETQMLEAAENTKAQLEQQRMNSRAALTVLRVTSASREDGTGEPSTGTDERVAAYEVAFRGMMRVAKVSTLDALVEAYQAEIEQQYRLQNDLTYVREAQEALVQEVQHLRERVKQTKYCVGAATRLATESAVFDAASAIVGTAPSPLMERELHTFVREEKESLAMYVGANEANQALVMEVAERVNHLAELVADYRADVRVPSIQCTAALAKSSSSLPLHVAVLAQKLLALAADAAGEADLGPSSTLSSPVKDARHGEGAVHDDKVSSSAAAVVSSVQIVIPANNRRVPLAHEGAGGGVGGPGPSGRRGRTAADVAGISSSAARALLHPHRAGPGGHEGGALRASANQRRRRSSAAAGAGFIESPEDEDDVRLAVVAALPPPGGRVLDFHGASTDTSELHSGIFNGSDAGGGARGGGDGTGGDNGSSHRAAAVTRGRRPFPKLPRHMVTAGATSAHQANVQSLARAVEDDQEDPLRREEVKRMSEMIRTRQKLEAEKDSRRP